MDTDIKIKALQYSDLVALGKLAAEAIELSQQYDHSRLRKYCNLIAACNMELIVRRVAAAARCGTKVSKG